MSVIATDKNFRPQGSSKDRKASALAGAQSPLGSVLAKAQSSQKLSPNKNSHPEAQEQGRRSARKRKIIIFLQDNIGTVTLPTKTDSTDLTGCYYKCIYPNKEQHLKDHNRRG